VAVTLSPTLPVMALSSRFPAATHILIVVALGGGEPIRSEYIAMSVNTDPGLIRRLLSLLARAGLTRSRLGAGGGTVLARPATEITLLDAYRAVEEGQMFATHRKPTSRTCPVGRHMQTVLGRRIEAATRAFEAELAGTTITDLLAEIGQRNRRLVLRSRRGARMAEQS